MDHKGGWYKHPPEYYKLIGGLTMPSYKPVAPVKINQIEDVLRVQIKILNEYRKKNISDNSARIQGYLSNLILSSYEKLELEKRLEAIEETLAERGL
jgi:hypothetical protein